MAVTRSAAFSNSIPQIFGLLLGPETANQDYLDMPGLPLQGGTSSLAIDLVVAPRHGLKLGQILIA